MQIAATCQDVPGIWTEKEKRGLRKGAKLKKADSESKRQSKGNSDHVWKLLCSWPHPPTHRVLFTPAWSWWRSVWHAIGHSKGQDDKHMASGIIENKYVCWPVFACITLSNPTFSQLVSSYRWLARWHGILLSKQKPAICHHIWEKLFSL